MRPQGSPEELERRRRRGIDLLQAGASVTEVARRLGCSHSSVILWREAVRRRGLTALTAKPAPGRPPKLTAAQQRQLPRLLLRGATTWDYDTDLWTTGRIATVIHRTFGVRLHGAHVGRLLTTLGWSCQKPERRAVERDDAAIALETVSLDRGKKNAERLNAHLVFLDECGFLLIPNVRRTWAPRGPTPIIPRDRRDFVAAIPMPDDRRGAGGRPGAPDVGNQQEATFVEEHQMGVQALRVFFTATQRYRVQRAMAASSRSTARRSGFWHDQPSVVSSRPT